MRDYCSIQKIAVVLHFDVLVRKSYIDSEVPLQLLCVSAIDKLKSFTSLLFFSSRSYFYGALRVLTLLLLVHLNFQMVAQFTDVTNQYAIYVDGPPGVSTGGVSFHDFNRDGLDDLTFATNGYGVYTYSNTGNGYQPEYYFSGITGDISHPIWVDFDNDDDADFFATRPYNCPILYRNEGDMTFTDVSSSLECISEDVLSYCASWGDYDNDSFLDVYIGNYAINFVGLNSWLYHNNGDGTFTEMAMELGVDNGINPTYQCMWIDYDQDIDQDLLVLNDKHQGCKLYQNNGDGSFINIADEVGFNVIIDAMSLSVSDFDHDEDFDFYISNTVEGNVFLKNEDGQFVDRAAELNTLVNAACWGSVFVDVEGKSWEDLYVVSTGPDIGDNVLLKNSQGSSFNENYTSFQGLDACYRYATAKGDCNNDGSYDIASTPYMPVGSTLFQNQAPGSNWIKISLQGSVSNHDGVGSIIKVYTDNGIYTRALTCGENFISQDSQHLIYGLWSSSVVDSITVQWPSGWMDTFYGLPANQNYLLVEGANFSNASEYYSFGICSGDSLLLNPGIWSNYLWQDGNQNDTIAVYSPGTYQVLVTNEYGLTKYYYFEVVEVEIPMYEFTSTNPSCHGMSDGEISLQTQDESLLFYLNGTQSTNTVSGLVAGSLAIQVMTPTGCSVMEELTLMDPPALSVNFTVSEVCNGENAPYNIEVFDAQGDFEIVGIENFNGQLGEGIYPFSVVDENGCSVYDTLRIDTPDPISFSYQADTICIDQITSLVYTIDGGIPPYEWMNESIDPEEMTCGIYDIWIEDDMDCTASFNVEIYQDPAMTVSAIVTSPVNGNDGSISLDIEGGISPYSVLWNTEATDVNLTNLFPGVYNCSVEDANGCVAYVEEIVVPLGMNEFTHQNTVVSFHEDQIIIRSQATFDYRLWDVNGKLWMSGKGFGYEELHTNQLACGSYIVSINDQIFKVAVTR